LAGCVGEEPPGRVSAAGSVDIEGVGSASVVLDLGSYEEPSLDAVVLVPERLQVDVFVPAGSSRFELFGAFFTGELVPEQITRGLVDGRGALALRLEGKRVMLMSGVPYRPHRLNFPVQIYDWEGDNEIHHVSFGDLSGDASDDLLVAEDTGIVVITELGPALDANPEDPPWLDRFTLDDGYRARGAVAIPPLGEERPGAVAIAREEPSLRIYTRVQDGYETTDVELPALGRDVLPARCAEWGAIIVLEDGRLMAVPRGVLAVEPLQVVPVRAMASAGDAWAAVDGGGYVALSSGCTEVSTPVRWIPTATQIDVSSVPAGDTLLSALSDGGTRLDLFRAR
ncbi:MAG TPA: hypothetical protein VLS89_09645, partial [Candidatus Nanopelagicales bacterium]|nr:hypothetical protein [Candidatus Nanopelagicales bacterium]